MSNPCLKLLHSTVHWVFVIQYIRVESKLAACFTSHLEGCSGLLATVKLVRECEEWFCCCKNVWTGFGQPLFISSINKHWSSNPVFKQQLRFRGVMHLQTANCESDVKCSLLPLQCAKVQLLKNYILLKLGIYSFEFLQTNLLKADLPYLPQFLCNVRLLQTMGTLTKVILISRSQPPGLETGAIHETWLQQGHEETILSSWKCWIIYSITL